MESVPPDVVHGNIVAYLDPVSLLHLRVTSRAMHAFAMAHPEILARLVGNRCADESIRDVLARHLLPRTLPPPPPFLVERACAHAPDHVSRMVIRSVVLSKAPSATDLSEKRVQLRGLDKAAKHLRDVRSRTIALLDREIEDMDRERRRVQERLRVGIIRGRRIRYVAAGIPTE